MAKVYFDSDKLNSDFLGYLDSLKTSLKNAKSIASSFDVPSVYYDYFRYKSYLQSLDSDITTIITNAESIETWVKSSIKSYQTFSDNAVESFNKIEDIEIKPRESIVIAR